MHACPIHHALTSEMQSVIEYIFIIKLCIDLILWGHHTLIRKKYLYLTFSELSWPFLAIEMFS